jgi:hypothetical protein
VNGNWDDLTTTPPRLVAIAGDWHGNHLWARHAISKMSGDLPATGPRLVIHVGDWGLWPGKNSYVSDVSQALDDYGMTMWMIDGNHDDHSQLAALHATEPGPVPLDDAQRIWHLPRGTRWDWHGVRWLAVGGAGSPDAPRRIPGVSWWPQEVITATEASIISAGGEADVLVAHDCPRAFMPTLPGPPAWWDLTLCHQSSDQLQFITDSVQPVTVFHGHLHMSRNDVFNTTWGSVNVVGLDMDGEDGNWSVVLCRNLETTHNVTT